jgi:hypothetical protein
VVGVLRWIACSANELRRVADLARLSLVVGASPSDARFTIVFAATERRLGGNSLFGARAPAQRLTADGSSVENNPDTDRAGTVALSMLFDFIDPEEGIAR